MQPPLSSDAKSVPIGLFVVAKCVTKLLDQAIEKVRELPESDQDDAAEMLLWAIETRNAPIPLDDATAAAIDEGLAQARRGEFASDAEIAALWKRHAL